MGLNKFLFTGNLTRDAEIASTTGDRARAHIRIAVNDAWTDEQGQRHERANFFNITVWGSDAENAAKYLGKGSLIFVEGRLASTEWEKDGEKRYGTDFVATHIQYVDTKKPGSDNA
ncbi:single-stranded DNA-binding protein [Sphingopyxis sp. MG]|jgi:single-strand DNA-binding protein|uniref:single-stranded DNA-binding protein n=1 Tax=Sphingopyxis sp. MG TaxID=1866325 RepID=UPI000CDF3AFF|nr:single-stranded DNA-binding protein [Sphingopyxis sp. MG]AVA16150.1 single-stranded DNA-binding protein [Sphingopyxis sp. MG]